MRQERWAGIRGQVHQPAQQRPQRRLPQVPQIPGAGAAFEERDQLFLLEPQAEVFEIGAELRVALGLGAQDQVDQHLAHQQIAFAVFQRARSGAQARLFGKGGEQPLRKGVDRFDADAAARAIEHRGKPAARALACVRIAWRADCLKMLGQRGIGQAHPVGQPFSDTLRHFRRACLGERQAQDLVGLHPRFQQQPQHARGQHLGLAGACRGAQPDGAIGIDRVQLVAVERMDRIAAVLAPAHGVSSRPCHSSSRIN